MRVTRLLAGAVLALAATATTATVAEAAPAGSTEVATEQASVAHLSGRQLRERAWEQACEQMMRMPKPAMEAVCRAMMHDPMGADTCRAMMRKYSDMAAHCRAMMPDIMMSTAS